MFRRGRPGHLIEAPVGRIGVGICAGNQFAAHLALMHELQAGLIVMAHAGPARLGRAGRSARAGLRSRSVGCGNGTGTLRR